MSVRFKLDENLPRDAITLLLNAGHDAHSVLDEGLGGSEDQVLLDVCRNEGRVFVTFDLDFSDLRLYPPLDHKGIWVLRPQTQSVANTLALLENALGALETESTEDRLWIIESGRIRVRE